MMMSRRGVASVALLVLAMVAMAAAGSNPLPSKHLLVDMHGLESLAGAEFVMNAPTCDRVPVLLPDAPWEIAANLSFNIYHSVIVEPNGVVRVWYNLVNASNTVDATPYLVAYAVSTDDGATFTKPLLHQYKLLGSTANNIIGAGMSTPVMREGLSVWADPSESLGGKYVSQADVYRCHMEAGGQACPFGAIGFSTSMDGANWTSVGAGWDPGSGGSDTQSNVFADPWTGDFVLVTRDWNSSAPKYRAMRTLTCPKGQLSPATVDTCWSDQHVVMTPDRLDRCHVGETCDETRDVALDCQSQLPPPWLQLPAASRHFSSICIVLVRQS